MAALIYVNITSLQHYISIRYSVLQQNWNMCTLDIYRYQDPMIKNNKNPPNKQTKKTCHIQQPGQWIYTSESKALVISPAS